MTRRSFAAGLLLAGAGRAQDESSRIKRGRELVDACIRALGGPAFLNMQDRLETGRAFSFYREKLSGLSIAHLYTRYETAPSPTPVSYDGILERQSFGKKQDYGVLFNPNGGFDITFRGVRPLPDDAVAKHKESTITNILYILRQRMHEPGISFEAGGLQVMENQQVETLVVYDGADRKITVALTQSTKLPVMQSYMRLDPTYKERVEEITRFTKYRDAGGGVMWPLDIGRERDGEKIYQMFSDSVTVGNNFDAKLFTLPRDMQMLKKENF